MRQKGAGGAMSEKKYDAQNNFPLLPLRDVIIFPHMVVPLFVGREKSDRKSVV